jgi:hypothetical protein
MFELHETAKQTALTFSHEVPRIIGGLEMGVK